jgi:rhodanese-related sulfurtransferase
MNYEITAPELATLLMSASSSSSTDGMGSSPTDPVLLLDVREPWEVSVSAIPGHIHIAMGDIPSHAHQALDPDSHIVVYCHLGMRSLSVTHWLREQGFERAQSLAGGIDAWSSQIDASVPRY